MSTPHMGEGLPNNSAAEPRRTGLSIFRRVGHTALDIFPEPNSTPEGMSGYVESSPLPFDLYEPITKYQELWYDHQSIIEDALSDGELASDFQNLMLSYAAALSTTPDKKQNISKIGTTGFSKIVNLFVASGRLKASSNDFDFSQSISRLAEDAYAKGRDIKRVQTKTNNLFSPDNMTVSKNIATRVNNKLLTLEENAKKTYKPIYNLGKKIEISIFDELVKNSESSVKLIETFLKFSDSEIEVEKTFVRFLSNHYELLGAESELGYALSMVQSLATSNIFSNDFMRARLAKDGGDNLMSFISTKLFSSVDEFIKLMSNSFNEWPNEYKQAYKTYMAEKLQSYTLTVQKQVQLTKHRAWFMTDLSSIEETVDRYWRLFYKDYAQPELRVPAKQQKGRVAQRNKLSVDDVGLDAQYQSEKTQPIRQIIEVRRNNLNQFESKNDLSVEDILKRQLGNDAQAIRLVEIYLHAIEILKTNPFPSKGVASTANQLASHIIIDGRRVKIYRANPTQLPGVKAPKELQRGRIIYAVDKDNLIIIGVFASHDKYEKFITTL